MSRTFTCIICPNGCDIEAKTEGREILSLEGALCERGRGYVIQELRNPQRTIASSVPVEGGEAPLVSVRVSAPIPKGRIFDVMKVIRSLRVSAPVLPGDVLASGILGLACDIVATKRVRERPADAARKAQTMVNAKDIGPG